MALDTATDKSTVNLVVLMLGVAAIVGLLGLIYLIHDGVAASTLLAISTPVATIVGALGAVLSSTRSVDVGGLNQIAAQQQAGLDQSEAAAKLHAQLTKPTGDFNPPDYPSDEALVADLGSTDPPGEQLV